MDPAVIKETPERAKGKDSSVIKKLINTKSDFEKCRQLPTASIATGCARRSTRMATSKKRIPTGSETAPDVATSRNSPRLRNNNLARA